MNREQIYDAQIAPLMAQIIDICKANQINAHMTFDLSDPDRQGEGDVDSVTTHLPVNGCPAWLRNMGYMAKAKDNFDAFMMAVMRDAKEYGHSSLYLTVLEGALK